MTDSPPPTPGSSRAPLIVGALFVGAILILLLALGGSLVLLADSWTQISPDDPPEAAVTAAPLARTPTPDPREQEPAPTAGLPGIVIPTIELPDIAATVQAVQGTAQAGLPGGVSLPGAQPDAARDQFLLEVGAGGTGDGQLSDPRGVAVGPGGEIYVADYGGGRVQRFGPEGAFELGWRVEDERPIMAIAAGADGRVYVSQVSGVAIYEGASGERLGLAAEGAGFEDMVVLADGSLLGFPWGGKDLVRLDPDGRELDRIEDPLGAAGSGDMPAAVAADGSGALYVMGAFRGEIFVLGPEGERRATISAPDATFFPQLAADSQGRIYVSTLLGGIQIFGPDGARLGAIATPGFAFDLTFDAAGDLYAVTNAPRLLKIRVAPQ